MTRYRFRGIFLLLLMGHATACATTTSTSTIPTSTTSWQSPGTIPKFIEETQPDRVHVLTEDGTVYEVPRPSVEGDNIVSVDSLSVPIADIVVFWIRQQALSATSSGVSVAGYVEESQPELIRVRTQDRGQFDMDFPFVVGDNIVSVDSLSVPIADIVELRDVTSLLEPPGKSYTRVLLGVIGVGLLTALYLGAQTEEEEKDPPSWGWLGTLLCRSKGGSSC
jgi:hypothetical protein